VEPYQYLYCSLTTALQAEAALSLTQQVALIRVVLLVLLDFDVWCKYSSFVMIRIPADVGDAFCSSFLIIRQIY